MNKIKQRGTRSSCYEQALRKTGIEKLAVHSFLSQGSMHLNAHKMNGGAEELCCLEDK